MRYLSEIYAQFSSSKWLFIILYTAAATIFLVSTLAARYFDIDIGQFTRDPVSIMKAPIYTGLISNVGILFWCASAAVCSLGFMVNTKKLGNQRISLFLLTSAVLSTLLLLDDLFLFHETLFPMIGISERKVYAIYLVLIAAYLIGMRVVILATDFSIIALAFAFFAVSISADVIGERFVIQPNFSASLPGLFILRTHQANFYLRKKRN